MQPSTGERQVRQLFDCRYGHHGYVRQRLAFVGLLILLTSKMLFSASIRGTIDIVDSMFMLRVASTENIFSTDRGQPSLPWKLQGRLRPQSITISCLEYSCVWTVNERGSTQDCSASLECCKRSLMLCHCVAHCKIEACKGVNSCQAGLNIIVTRSRKRGPFPQKSDCELHLSAYSAKNVVHAHENCLTLARSVPKLQSFEYHTSAYLGFEISAFISVL